MPAPPPLPPELLPAACAPLLCDHCRQPGRCCVGFGLNMPLNTSDTVLHVLVKLASIQHYDCQGRPQIGVPFMPLHRKPDGRTPAGWRFCCPLLDRNGRCTDYENRPALCALYRPGTDGICVEHRPGTT